MPLVVHFLSNSAWKPSQEPLLEAAYILTGDQNDYVFFFGKSLGFRSLFSPNET